MNLEAMKPGILGLIGLCVLGVSLFAGCAFVEGVRQSNDNNPPQHTYKP